MPPLYPMHSAMHSLALGLVVALAGCGDDRPPPQAQEPWPNEYEAVFQQAEALKYSLQQQELEAQQLREAGVPVTPPAPR